jgi:hypothetical protein
MSLKFIKAHFLVHCNRAHKLSKSCLGDHFDHEDRALEAHCHLHVIVAPSLYKTSSVYGFQDGCAQRPAKLQLSQGRGGKLELSYKHQDINAREGKLQIHSNGNSKLNLFYKDLVQQSHVNGNGLPKHGLHDQSDRPGRTWKACALCCNAQGNVLL